MHSMFASRVLGVGGLDGTICGSITYKMAADGHLEYTKMATTLQAVFRSTRCLLVDSFVDVCVVFVSVLVM